MNFGYVYEPGFVSGTHGSLEIGAFRAVATLRLLTVRKTGVISDA